MRLLFLCFLFLTGCASTLRVTSSPPGARVLIDGRDSGEVTPTNLRRSELGGAGVHKITVALDGHKAPTEKEVDAHFAFKTIIGSLLFPPLVIVNAWRGFSDVAPREAAFELEKQDGPAAAP